MRLMLRLVTSAAARRLLVRAARSRGVRLGLGRLVAVIGARRLLRLAWRVVRS